MSHQVLLSKVNTDHKVEGRTNLSSTGVWDTACLQGCDPLLGVKGYCVLGFLLVPAHLTATLGDMKESEYPPVSAKQYGQ